MVNFDKVESKKWYFSKTFIAAFLGLLFVVLSANGVMIPEEVYVVLGSLGLVGLRTAKTPVKKSLL